MIALIFIATCLALVIFYQQSVRFSKHRSFLQRHQCYPAPRYPQRERLLGLGLMLRNVKAAKATRLLPDLRSRFRLMGNTYSATVAGNRNIFTIEPRNIKAIFADRFNDFDTGWQRRRAFAPSIGNKQLFTDYSFYERDIDLLLQQVPSDASTIDLAPLFYTHALNLASRLLFDESLAALNPEFGISSDRFIEAFQNVNNGNQRRIVMGRLLPLIPRDRLYEDSCRVVHEYGDIFVKRALAYRQSWRLNKSTELKGVEETRERYVFLQEIAKEIDDPLELRNHLLGMLLVGSETTASLLTGCLSLLSTRPQLWARLHREATDIGVPNSESIRQFESLSHVINEVMRLYPILPLFGRMANKDTVLPVGGGPQGNSPVFVPKGALAMINTYSLHRRPDIFGNDADGFKPERWASLKLPDHWRYLPFGGGPRICIGQQYALTEVSYTLIRFLQAFPTIVSRDPRPWLEVLGISLTNGNGAKVAFETV
ncbi:MAG: hypothetical protein Q9168_005419 [Polycauliona sp. 1 TL-2023]